VNSSKTLPDVFSVNPIAKPKTNFPPIIVHIFSIMINPIAKKAIIDEEYKQNLLPFDCNLLQISPPIAIPGIGA